MQALKVFVGLALAFLIGCKSDAVVYPTTEVTTDDKGVIQMLAGDTLEFEVYVVTQGMETQGWSCDGDDPKRELTSTDDSIATLVGPLYVHKKEKVNGQDTYADLFIVVAVSEGDVMIHGDCGGAEGSARIHVSPRGAK